MQLKLVCFIAFIVVLSYSDAERMLCGRFQTWNLNRIMPHYATPGFYVQQIDRTVFTVSKLFWLKEFIIPKVYAFDPVKEVPINDVMVNITIIETSQLNPEQKTIFTGETIVNSTKEATIIVGELNLKPGFIYNIEVEIPNEIHLMYNELLEIKEFSLKRFLRKTINVKFFQRNSPSKPPTDGNTARQPSHGIVKQLILKYKWF